MQKTIVCIIEEELILNYLFTKELYDIEDKVLLITQFKLRDTAERFRKLFEYIKEIDIISLEKDGDEDYWDCICTTVRKELKLRANENYYVNLSGGTRLMSMAVQLVFGEFNSKFFFMPFDRNVIIHSQIDNNNENNDDIISQISHKITVAEYLSVNGIASKQKEPTYPKEYTNHFYEFFIGNYFSNKEFDIIDTLRNRRDHNIEISKIKGLYKFLRYIDFPKSEETHLSLSEVQYLTGGWFEEYIYHMVKETLTPDDIAMSVKIKRDGSDFQNELDVVFTIKNNLYVIECKTGVGKKSLYHQIVYKACALRESLLGIRSNSFIFSLNEDYKQYLEQTARNMGIQFCGREFAEDREAFKHLLNIKRH